MTPADRRFLAECRRPPDRVRFYTWLGITLVLGAFWVGVGFVVAMLINGA